MPRGPEDSMIGEMLGPYRVIAKLGEGGMGVVYRARDATLERDVAIKVLPPGVAADAERVERFRREARVLASLNHPNIAAIYGFEETPDASFLVLELVEGEDLAARLARGPVPLADALAIARQIAEALEDAHDRGVIHRDLKPANVKVTEAGRVKVLDFGLAKVLLPELGPHSGQDAELPTVTSPARTEHGVILGTAAYMAPEQARGKVVDRRADIWAFGVLLYELLLGRRLFRGETMADVMSQVISGPIDLDALPADVPGPVRVLLARCLDRDQTTRLRDIGEARIAIDGALLPPEAPAAASAAPAAAAGWGTYLPWSLAAVAVAVAIGIGLSDRSAPTEAPGDPIVSALLPPEGHSFNTARGPMAFSPDGLQIAFSAVDAAGQPVLAVRQLSSGDARVIPGTEDASHPFWSPDGRTLGYFARRKLMRIDVDGGNRRELAEAPMADGGTWSPDGTIVFAPGGWGAPIAMIDEQSGPVTDVADADPQGMTDYMQSPSFLPDGVHFLFSVHEQSTQGSGIWLGTTDGSAPHHLLTATVSSPVYVDPGFVMYWTPDGRVIARPFDLATSTFGDEETVVATDVGFSWIVSGLFTASRSGLVAYLATGSDGAGSELAWVNRQGEFIERLAPASGYYAPRLSRDGRRVVVDNSTPLADLYVFTTPGRPPNRLTDDPADETLPVWSFDDTAVYFYRVGATEQIFRRRLVDGDTPVMLIDDGAPVDASPDGRWLLFRRHVEGQSDMFGLWLFDLESNAERPWVASPYSNRSGAFAPDGGWIAYCTNETGRLEIYLQTYPDLGTKIAVSADGGVAPIWSSDGRTLYYRSLTDQIMEVPILFTADQPDVGTARPLFEMPMRTLGGWAPQFAPSTDGQRFLVNRLVEGRSELPMMLLQNWMSRARRPKT